jgi:alcohol dehydrogenase
MERRVLGSIYGSTFPERDFALTLELYRRGRLPLDRLITHRVPLERVQQGLDLLLAGEAIRAVVDLRPQGAR